MSLLYRTLTFTQADPNHAGRISWHLLEFIGGVVRAAYLVVGRTLTTDGANRKNEKRTRDSRGDGIISGDTGLERLMPLASGSDTASAANLGFEKDKKTMDFGDSVNQLSPSWNKLENLVLVAGHAIYVGKENSDADHDEHWILKSFQKGESSRYIEHIRFGVELAASLPNAMIIFSGGQTRREAGPRSEAQSYWLLADQFAWWQKLEVRDRATTEEFACDSFQNMLFGIARFRECSGHYPLSIDIVGWEYKRGRFDFHRQTIRWPASGRYYRYHGVNNPADRITYMEGETKVMASFKKNPFGLEKDILSKRIERNPFKRQSPYAISCPEIGALLNHQKPNGIELKSRFPWESLSS